MDKLRKSDPGILIRVSPELSYWEFAKLAACYLSGDPNYLRFFIPHLPPSSAGGVNTISNKSSNVATQDLHASSNNPSVASEPGSGNNFSPNSGATLISEQSRAAKASGFALPNYYIFIHVAPLFQCYISIYRLLWGVGKLGWGTGDCSASRIGAWTTRSSRFVHIHGYSSWIPLASSHLHGNHSSDGQSIECSVPRSPASLCVSILQSSQNHSLSLQ